MRMGAVVKILVVLLLDFSLFYAVCGIGVAAGVTALLMLYAWLGEYLGLWKDGAIRLENLNSYEQSKLVRVHASLARDVQHISGIDISGLKLHVIPADEINAYAYGFRHVAVTRGTLRVCDDATLCSVLGHELSHILHLDAVFHRLIFANVLLVLLALMLSSFVSVSVLWLVFLVLCLFGVCRGLFSILMFQGISKLVKGMFTILQYALVSVYQVIMGLVSRHCEFRADRYSCQLGYGPQLRYFLMRFVQGQEVGKKTWSEILYASHPPTDKRILRIEQHCCADVKRYQLQKSYR